MFLFFGGDNMVIKKVYELKEFNFKNAKHLANKHNLTEYDFETYNNDFFNVPMGKRVLMSKLERSFYDKQISNLANHIFKMILKKEANIKGELVVKNLVYDCEEIDEKVIVTFYKNYTYDNKGIGLEHRIGVGMKNIYEFSLKDNNWTNMWSIWNKVTELILANVPYETVSPTYYYD